MKPHFYESSFAKGFEVVNGKMKHQFSKGLELESDGKQVEGIALDNGRVRRLHFDLPSFHGRPHKKFRTTPHPKQRRRSAPKKAKGKRRTFRRRNV